MVKGQYIIIMNTWIPRTLDRNPGQALIEVSVLVNKMILKPVILKSEALCTSNHVYSFDVSFQN